jgi:hypothetical protein
MLGAAAPYLVAFSMMVFAGVSALTLMYAIDHFDPPDVPMPQASAPEMLPV